MTLKFDRIFLYTALFLLIGIGLCANAATVKNGFVLDGASIPTGEIRFGGPPRDGIPAIIQGKYVSITEADFMGDEDRLIGLVINNEARAYPIKILDHHELVNDSIGDRNFVVSYCPLCGTGMVFATNIGEGNALIFGVSGLLYNSDVLLYDLNTESLWSQIMSEAVTGKLKGVKLQQLPALHTSFADWKEKYPESKILSTETGYQRNYEESPYANYEKTRRLYFRVSHRAPGNYHPKEQVMGLEVNGVFKAYPFVELSKQGRSFFSDEVGGQKLRIYWNEDAKAAYVENEAGRVLASTVGYWFAWFTFHPETEVFTGGK